MPPSSAASFGSSTRPFNPSISARILPSHRVSSGLISCCSSWLVSGMQQTPPQCTSCGAFTRRSLHHEDEYQSSVLLERLRTTNFPATDDEISHIRHTILPTVSDDISSIDAKVESLREVITSMEEERERLIHVQKRYNNLVSLHRSLPLEIWSEIFLYTLSTPSDFNAFDASESIWKLSHVCQRWRNIALSLHSFWSTVNIEFYTAAQHERGLQRLETVIQRSHQGLLDVCLRGDVRNLHNSGSIPSIQQRMLDIILAESYRWQKLQLWDWRGRLHMLYAPLRNRLPRLESAYLHWARIEPREHSVVSIFKDCPRLTKLTLCGGSSLGVEFPWDQITELDLSSMDVSGSEERRACMDLLGWCPSLEILHTPSWHLEDDEDESPYSPITISNLGQLYATSVPVLDSLTLPSLQEASLYSDPGASHSDVLYLFKRILFRSNCVGTLTSLSVHNVPLAPSPNRTLHSILSETYNLTFLHLAISILEYDIQEEVGDWEQINTTVESLEIIPTRAVTFLPLLSSLNIRIHNFRDSAHLQYFEPVHSLALTLKTRWKGDDTLGLARLRRCHFIVHAWNTAVFRDDVEAGRLDVFNEEEHGIFNALIDEGMDLSIRVTSNLTGHGRLPVFAGPSL